MKPLPKTAGTVLDRLTDGLNPPWEKGSSRRVDTAPDVYMAVSVERIRDKTYSVAHYYKQQGDLIPDPEMTFLKDDEGNWYPLTIQHAPPFNRYIVLVELDENETVTGFRPRAYKDASIFARTWMKNIKTQQDLPKRARKRKSPRAPTTPPKPESPPTASVEPPRHSEPNLGSTVETEDPELEEKRRRYAERVEARRDRLERRADKKRSDAAAARKRSDDITDHIPPGQPILVGHHSEKRHRRDLDRSHQAMRRSIEADKEAKRLQQRAASVGSGGISSDDPDAIAKLEAKVRGLEEERERWKFLRAEWRKNKKRCGTEADFIRAVGLTKEEANDIHYSVGEGPPTYILTNLGANIRSVKQRIESLRKEAARVPSSSVSGNGWEIHEDQDDNRIHIHFDAKPNQEVRAFLKKNGWRWSPSRNAWVRQLNNASRYAAKVAAERLHSLLS